MLDLCVPTESMAVIGGSSSPWHVTGNGMDLLARPGAVVGPPGSTHTIQGHIVGLPDGEHPFYFVLTCCDAPDCPCTDVILDFVEFAGTEESPAMGTRFKVTLNVATWREVEPPRRDRHTAALVDDFISGMTEELKASILENRARIKRDGADRLGRQERTGTSAQPGRNAPCPCGSGKKYKRCCGREGSA